MKNDLYDSTYSYLELRGAFVSAVDEEANKQVACGPANVIFVEAFEHDAKEASTVNLEIESCGFGMLLLLSPDEADDLAAMLRAKAAMLREGRTD